MITVFGNKIKRESLKTTVERPTWAKSFWQGVPHRELADTLVETLEENDFKVIRELWATAMQGTGLVGGLDIVNPNFPDLEDASYSIALIHDNNGRKAITLTAGSRVTVCENGILTGEYILRKRHTKNLDLKEEMVEAVMKIGEQLSQVGTMTEQLKAATIDENKIFIEIGRKKLMNWTRLGRAVNEYHNPTYEEFSAYKGTAYGVYNALNHIVKEVSPIKQVNFLRRFTDFLKRENILRLAA